MGHSSYGYRETVHTGMGLDECVQDQHWLQSLLTWREHMCLDGTDVDFSPCALQVKVPVCVFAFDCLFVDGETLLKETLEARRARMAAALPGMRPGFVCLAKSHRLQGLKPTLARQAQPDTGAGKTSGAGNKACADSRYGEIPSAERVGAEELHAGDAVTDLVSEDEGADGAALSLSMLEKQAPGPQDTDRSGGEPVTLR